MDWGDLPSQRITELERLSRWDPTRMLARLDAGFALRHREPQRCRDIANDEIAHAQLRGNRHALAVGYVVRAYSGLIDDPEALLERMRMSCDVLEEIGDRFYELRVADLLATIFEGMGDFPTSLEYTEKALRLSRETSDRLFEGYSLSSMAGILTSAGQLNAASARIDEALTIAQEIGVDRLRCRLLIRRGRVERALNRPDEALASFKHAQSVAEHIDADFTQIDAMTEIARCHEDAQQFDEAERLYDEALRRMDDDMRTMIGPAALLGLARVCNQTGQMERGIELLQTLQELAQLFSVRPILCEATKLLAHSLHQMERFEAAYDALHQYIELKEEIMRGEADRALKKFKVKADLEAAQKDAEIYRLKYVELETMQTQLVESERLAIVGSLTAGLTHEMNTPLGAIRSGLDITQRALARLQDGLPSESNRAVEASTSALRAAETTSRTALARLEGLVGSFRRFSRLDEADYQRLDLVDGLEATIDLLSSSLPTGIRIQRTLRPVPVIRGWPGALNQAFMTLMKNAAEALQAEGTIRIETEVRPAPLPEVLVRIADNGPGIPQDVKDRLFELELSRDGPRARFRVGLATVQSVVQRHQGRIEVVSEVGSGTEFQLFFPAEAA